MQEVIRKIFILFKLKLKFAAVSLVATGFHFVFYSLFVLVIFPADGTPATSKEITIITAIGAFIGMLINFFMQKRFVFDLQRTVSSAFILALMVSLVGIAINTGIVAWLTKYSFFMQSGLHKLLPQLIATGTVFFYNFYLKRFIFEKRFFSVD